VSRAGILAIVAATGMAAGGAIAFRPFLFRETVTLRSELPDSPETAAFSRGVRLALEEHGFRAGVFRVVHENHPQRPYPWGSRGPQPPPLTVPIPRPGIDLAPLHAPRSPRPEADPGFFRRRAADFRNGEFAAEWAKERGIRSVYRALDRADDTTGVFPDDHPRYWHSNMGMMYPNFTTWGLLVAGRRAGLSVAGSEAVPEGDFEYRHLVARVARWRTDLVYVDAEGEGARLARDLRAKGYRGRILLSSRPPEATPSRTGSSRPGRSSRPRPPISSSGSTRGSGSRRIPIPIGATPRPWPASRRSPEGTSAAPPTWTAP